MKLYDGLAAHPFVVRLFMYERKGLTLDVVPVDMANLENRRLAYRQINPRGEVPALQLDDGRVIADVVAICEYLDEVAGHSSDGGAGQSLFGADAAQRAETRAALRRADLEIAQPLIAWWRNDAATIDYYRGHRVPNPDGRHVLKLAVNQALNRLEDELEAGSGAGGGGGGGATWLCGDRFSAADVLLFGLVKPMLAVAAWADAPSRPCVAAWFARMDARDAVKHSLMPFAAGRLTT